VSVGHEPFDTLAALHAVGALDGEDLSALQTHLATGCARCETVVRQTEQTLARAAMAGPPEPPPAAVRDALMRRLAAASARGRARWLPWAAGAAAAAVAAAALTVASVAGRYEARLGEMARETSAARERLARSEAELRDEVAAYRDAIELLREPAARVTELRGRATAAGAVARVLWTERAGGMLLASRLPPAPPGTAYALWIIEGDAARPAGMFAPDGAGKATLRIAAKMGGAPAGTLAVTLEPAGGAPRPTGAVVLASR
jgi:anti-sigma-K factor RskA